MDVTVRAFQGDLPLTKMCDFSSDLISWPLSRQPLAAALPGNSTVVEIAHFVMGVTSARAAVCHIWLCCQANGGKDYD